ESAQRAVHQELARHVVAEEVRLQLVHAAMDLAPDLRARRRVELLAPGLDPTVDLCVREADEVRALLRAGRNRVPDLTGIRLVRRRPTERDGVELPGLALLQDGL